MAKHLIKLDSFKWFTRSFALSEQILPATVLWEGQACVYLHGV